MIPRLLQLTRYMIPQTENDSCGCKLTVFTVTFVIIIVSVKTERIYTLLRNSLLVFLGKYAHLELNWHFLLSTVFLLVIQISVNFIKYQTPVVVLSLFIFETIKVIVNALSYVWRILTTTVTILKPIRAL